MEFLRSFDGWTLVINTLTVAAKRQKVDKVGKIKTCIFKGCRVTENEEQLVQNSCKTHYVFIKERGTI